MIYFCSDCMCTKNPPPARFYENAMFVVLPHGQEPYADGRIVGSVNPVSPFPSKSPPSLRPYEESNTVKSVGRPCRRHRSQPGRAPVGCRPRRSGSTCQPVGLGARCVAMGKRNRRGTTTNQALTTEVIGVRVVTGSHHVPFDRKSNFIEINVESTDFNTRAVRIGDLNDQIAGPSGIVVKVGECQIDVVAKTPSNSASYTEEIPLPSRTPVSNDNSMFSPPPATRTSLGYRRRCSRWLHPRSQHSQRCCCRSLAKSHRHQSHRCHHSRSDQGRTHRDDRCRCSLLRYWQCLRHLQYRCHCNQRSRLRQPPRG